MKKIVIAALGFSFSLSLISCGGAHGDDPGHAYMPDMYYSRAYEAYGYNDVGGERDSLAARGINYNALLVPGTVARGDLLPYHLTSDSAGMKAADGLKNPTDSSTKNEADLKEGERLYLVNCGICHGPNLDGNGPLYKGGEGPYPAKPQVLNDAQAKGWADGHFYYVITFGKGQMGSYASQLRPEQRWMVINYIRSKQGGATKDSTATASAGAAMPATQSTVTTQASADAKK
jgi:mono/diheme cytochrome c family protein